MSGEPITILLIEDNPDHAMLVIRNFKTFQVANSIIHLEDGEQAIEFLSKVGAGNKRPHLVLLDLRLPKIDGLEVLRYIKTNQEISDIPVIVLTTSDAETDMARAYEFHANSYLIKPVDFPKFTELMNLLGFYWICWNKNPF
ncbi:MAG: response regulator [Bacteroidetes bacterium]|nr:response regulator [Bacteroidales bacterium]NJO68134.1 response regulator [Bacteroidota bacterium]